MKKAKKFSSLIPGLLVVLTVGLALPALIVITVNGDSNFSDKLRIRNWILFGLTAAFPFLAFDYFRRFLQGRIRLEVWLGAIVAFLLLTATAGWWWVLSQNPDLKNPEEFGIAFERARVPGFSSDEICQLATAIFLVAVGLVGLLLSQIFSRLVFRRWWKERLDETGRIPITRKTCITWTAIVAVTVAMISQTTIIPQIVISDFENFNRGLSLLLSASLFVPTWICWSLLYRWNGISRKKWLVGLASLTTLPVVAFLFPLFDRFTGGFFAGPTLVDPQSSFGVAIAFFCFTLTATLWHWIVRTFECNVFSERPKSMNWFLRRWSSLGWACRRFAYVATAAVWLFLTGWFVVGWSMAKPEMGPDAIRRSLVEEIGGDVERDDDWLVSLNRKHGSELTPEENAAVILVRLCPNNVRRLCEEFDDADKIVDEFFRAMGIGPEEQKAIFDQQKDTEKKFAISLLTDQLNQISGQGEAEKSRSAELIRAMMRKAKSEAAMDPAADTLDAPDAQRYLQNRISRIMDVPWSDSEFPEVANFLDRRTSDLSAIRRASTMAYYSPMLRIELPTRYDLPTRHPMNPGVTYPLRVRDLLQVSIQRALGNGDIEAAIDDIEVIRNWCRTEVMVQTFDSRTGLHVGQALINTALELIYTAASRPEATANQQQRLLEIVDELPSLADLLQSEWVKLPRYLRKDIVWKALVSSDKDFRVGDFENWPMFLGCTRMPWLVDWNFASQQMDVAHQRFIDEFVPPGETEPQIAPHEITRPVWVRFASELQLFFLHGPQGKASWFSTTYPRINPREGRINDLRELAALVLLTDERRLTKAAIALKMYRLEQGSYPATLAELVPNFLPAAPRDAFSYKTQLEFIYRPEAQTFVLYSRGRDGKDDGGANPNYDSIFQMNATAEQLENELQEILMDPATPDFQEFGW